MKPESRVGSDPDTGDNELDLEKRIRELEDTLDELQQNYVPLSVVEAVLLETGIPTEQTTELIDAMRRLAGGRDE